MFRRRRQQASPKSEDTTELLDRKKSEKKKSSCMPSVQKYIHRENPASKTTVNPTNTTTSPPVPVAKVLDYTSFIDLCKINYGENFDRKNFADYSADTIKEYVTQYTKIACWVNSNTPIIENFFRLDEQFIFTLMMNIPNFVYGIINFGININLNTVDDKGNTLLFYIKSYYDLVILLESSLVFDVNLLNHADHSFLCSVWHDIGNPPKHIMERLVMSLKKRNYNFNRHNIGTLMLEIIYEENMKESIALALLEIPEFDITTNFV